MYRKGDVDYFMVMAKNLWCFKGISFSQNKELLACVILKLIHCNIKFSYRSNLSKSVLRNNNNRRTYIHTIIQLFYFSSCTTQTILQSNTFVGSTCIKKRNQHTHTLPKSWFRAQVPETILYTHLLHMCTRFNDLLYSLHDIQTSRKQKNCTSTA